MISGSADHEEALSSTTVAHGVITSAFLQVMEASDCKLTYLELLARMHPIITHLPEGRRFAAQSPQLSSSLPVHFKGAPVII